MSLIFFEYKYNKNAHPEPEVGYFIFILLFLTCPVLTQHAKEREELKGKEQKLHQQI